MSRAPSWSVKGIDEETRAFARSAARAAGMTIGGWVDQAIRRVALRDLEAAERDRGRRSTEAQAQPGDRTAPASAGFSAGSADPEVSERDLENRSTVIDEAADAAVARPAGQPAPGARRSIARPMVMGLVGVVLIAGVAIGLRQVSGPGFEQAVAKADRPAVSEKTRPPAVAKSAAPISPPTSPPTADRGTAAAGRAAPVATVQRLLRAAREGNPVAQFQLAQAYASGEGIAKDAAAASRWLQRAAAQELVAAQVELGRRYEAGRGVGADPAMAAFWYRKAADWGDASAQYHIGRAYATGTGVPRDAEEAAQWLERAAAAGIVEALFSLAELHERGAGIARDRDRALALYRAAAAAGSEPARRRLAKLTFKRAAISPPPAAVPRKAPAKASAKTPPKPKVSSAKAATVIPRPPQAKPSPPAVARRVAAAVPPAAIDPRPAAPARKAATPSVGAKRKLPKRAIAEMQQMLDRLRFQPGKADGVMGAKTVRAIRRYQFFAGLKVNGVATGDLLSELRSVTSGIRDRR